MNEFIKLLKEDRIIYWGIIVSLGILVIELVYLFIFFSTLPPLLPIFNQMSWGQERLADKWMLFLPIVITLGIIILNIILTKYFYTKLPLIVRMIHITGILVSLFTLIFIFRIIHLII